MKLFFLNTLSLVGLLTLSTQALAQATNFQEAIDTAVKKIEEVQAKES